MTLKKQLATNTELCLELVDFNEIYGNGVARAAEPAKKTRRAGKKKVEATATEAAAPATEETATTTEEPIG
jgi:large subunit ribosomal protein L17